MDLEVATIWSLGRLGPKWVLFLDFLSVLRWFSKGGCILVLFLQMNIQFVQGSNNLNLTPNTLWSNFHWWLPTTMVLLDLDDYGPSVSTYPNTFGYLLLTACDPFSLKAILTLRQKYHGVLTCGSLSLETYFFLGQEK